MEDEPALRRLLIRTLERVGYTIESAADGPDAIARWQQQHMEFDIVVSDMMMAGGISGLELMKPLTSESPFLRSLVITGFSAEMADGSLDHPAIDSVLGKPFTPAVFLTAVDAQLATASTSRRIPHG